MQFAVKTLVKKEPSSSSDYEEGRMKDKDTNPLPFPSSAVSQGGNGGGMGGGEGKATFAAFVGRSVSKTLHRSASVHKFITFPAFPVSVIPAWLDGPYGCGITRLRHMLFLMLTETESKAGMCWAGIMIATIVLSIISFCIASMPEYRIRAARHIHGNPEDVFNIIETVCIVIFTVEYLGRLVCITAVPNKDEMNKITKHGFRRPKPTVILESLENSSKNSTVVPHSSSSFLSAAVPKSPSSPHRMGPLGYPSTYQEFGKLIMINTVKITIFLISPLNLIDVVAIVPYYVNIAATATATEGSSSLTILRVLRLARVLRLFKMSKRMQGWQLMAKTITKVTDALAFLVFFVVLAMVLFGSIIFFCEGGEWDEATETFLRPSIVGDKQESTPFQSIPHSFWWTMVTMVTLGYGDFVPTTDWGRLFGAILMLLSILVLAMPITVIGNSFSAEYNIAKRQKAVQLAAAATAAMNEKQQLSTHKSFQIPSGNPGNNDTSSLLRNSTGRSPSRSYSRPRMTVPGSSGPISTVPSRRTHYSSEMSNNLPSSSGSPTIRDNGTNSNIMNIDNLRITTTPSSSRPLVSNQLASLPPNLTGVPPPGTAAEAIFSVNEEQIYNEVFNISSNDLENDRTFNNDNNFGSNNDDTNNSETTSTRTGTDEDNDDDDNDFFDLSTIGMLASSADMAVVRAELFQLRADMAWVKGALEQLLRIANSNNNTNNNSSSSNYNTNSNNDGKGIRSTGNTNTVSIDHHPSTSSPSPSSSQSQQNHHYTTVHTINDSNPDHSSSTPLNSSHNHDPIQPPSTSTPSTSLSSASLPDVSSPILPGRPEEQ